MAFRTVVVSSNSKLELSLNYLVYRTVEETKRILINEIHTLIIQSTAVSITSALLCELINNKIKVIFCDEKNNPCSELVGYYNNCQTSKSIFSQVKWNKDCSDLIWKYIVKEKIKNQKKTLNLNGIYDKNEQFDTYIDEVEDGDVTNREGHAAKVYFNALFGSDFSRSDDNYINSALNYGYSIMLSQVNREIVALGYITQLGIHHKNINNEFNLGCDLVEILRPIVDNKAKKLTNDNNYKKEMIALLNIDVKIGGKIQSLFNAIKFYVSSILNALSTGEMDKICFIEEYEL